MLNWTILFLVMAVVSGALGFSGLALGAAQIAQILFVVFLVLFLVSLARGRRTPAI